MGQKTYSKALPGPAVNQPRDKMVAGFGADHIGDGAYSLYQHTKGANKDVFFNKRIWMAISDRQQCT